MPNPCCYRAALDLESGYCDECGQPLLRCAAFEECGGLLDGRAACGVCVAPELALDAGGVRDVEVGGALSLPLVLSNRSGVGRPLFVKGIWMREGTEAWRPLELSWDRLDGGAAAPFSVRTDVLDRAGVHHVEVLLAVATRWRWREEVAAYTAGVELTVAGQESMTVTQNISYDASAAQTGATIYAPLKLDASRDSRGQGEGPAEVQVLPLTRAGLLERTLGLRGCQDGPAVARGARFSWRGFANGAAPADGPITSADGMVSLGRSRAKASGGACDARFLVRGADGSVNEAASRAISRQHLGLCVDNDRLLLHVESERGGWVNGKRVPRGTVVQLRDGDTFSPLPRREAPLSVQVRFDAVHDVVESVTLTRHPAESEGTPS